MKHVFLTLLLSAIGFLSGTQNANFDLKKTEKTLVKISDGLYASKFEVSNKQYADFLNYLKQNNQTEKLNIAQVDSANWNVFSNNENPFTKYYHAHPAYNNYPIVNISYEAANLYCDWLTEQYNAGKKKKYRKVKFRLPTEEEWMIAAKGGVQEAIYPWEGNDFLSKNGEPRCNLKADPNNKYGNASRYGDNADVTAPVNSYWPNAFGIFNMSGNVSEMISFKGKTKGGSWMDGQEAIKIESVGEYADKDRNRAAIGFRYFMEIIEK
jgi:formylglycine-generating enzyme required for sulfatase activity